MYDSNNLMLDTEKSTLAASENSSFTYKGSYSKKVRITSLWLDHDP